MSGLWRVGKPRRTARVERDDFILVLISVAVLAGLAELVWGLARHGMA